MTHSVTVERGLAYAGAGGAALLADIYRPDLDCPPVVVYVHGGGWAVGSRSDYADERLAACAAHGIAVVSIDYRLVDVAHFPAQLHDVKAAVRWVRANAAGLGVRRDRIGIWGASAGAVLASLVALTGAGTLEGEVGDHLGESSAVDAVVSWFGASDLLTTASRSELESFLQPDGPEAAFLGVPAITDVPGVDDLARQASPLNWVTPDAPPFLLCHGDRDRVVSPQESHALHQALTRAGVPSSLLVLGGAGHEDVAFHSDTTIAQTAGFLRAVLGYSPTIKE